MRRARSKTSRCDLGAERWRSALVALLGSLSLASLACSDTTTVRPFAPRGSLGRSNGAATHVELRSLQDRPALAVVTRSGDPTAVLAYRFYAHEDAHALAAFAAVLSQRLSSAGTSPTLRADRRSLLLDVRVDAVSAARAVVAIRDALAKPVDAAELTSIRAHIEERLATVPTESEPATAALRACLGQPGGAASMTLDPSRPESVSRIERVRQSAFSRDRAVFSVVGPESAVSAVEQAIEDAPEWPAAGGLPASDPASAVSGATLVAGVPSGTTRLTVALRTSDPLDAIAASERLGSSPSPLGARASRHGFRITRTIGVADPAGGGCVAVSLERRGSNSDAEARVVDEAVREVTRHALREAQIEIDAGADDLDLAERVARAESGTEAARLAAWWAHAEPLANRQRATIAAASLELALDTPEPRRVELQKAAQSALADAPASSDPGGAETKIRVETGQTKTWVLVANPCAAVEEASHRWGASALATHAALTNARAAADSLPGEITVEAFTSSRGVGFIAQASPIEGESPAELGERVARAAASAFFVAPASDDAHLATQEIALRRLASRWMKNAPGLAALGGAIERPTMIEPFGPPNRLARFEPAELARRLHALSEGPIVVAVLARQDEAVEREAVSKQVARWMEPTTRTCEPVPRSRPGRSEVRETRKGAAVVHILLPLQAGTSSLAQGRIVAAMLAGPTGLLARGAAASPTTRATSRTVGPPGSPHLLVSLAGPEESIADVEREALQLLGRISRGELPETEIARAIAEDHEAALAELEDPRARLAKVLVDEPVEPAAPPKPADVRAWMTKNIKPDTATIVVAKPE